ncbi:MAG TPA: polyprenyl synthetase family protein [Thermoanaerobaculia bacterium]
MGMLLPLPGRAGGRGGLRLLPPAELRRVERAFRTLLPLGDGLEEHLRGALEDLLAHPGSLVRAQLAYGILAARGAARRRALALATAVEYFHTASLVFDDLPAMDDAVMRRGHPCPHVVHGEAAATLAGLALITRAYELLWRSLEAVPPADRRRAARVVAQCLGVGGILDGQARDVHFDPRAGGAASVTAVALGKTVPLIRLALVLPARVAGVAEEGVELLERLAEAWGLAYQAVDDFRDLLAGGPESGKSGDRDAVLGRPNLAHRAGRRQALERLSALLADGRALVAAVARTAPDLGPLLARVQEQLEEERRQVAERLGEEVAA